MDQAPDLLHDTVRELSEVAQEGGIVLNQIDVLAVLRDGPKTPSEILEILEPETTTSQHKGRLQSVQEKLRSLRKWELVEIVGKKDSSKLWAMTSKGREELE